MNPYIILKTSIPIADLGDIAIIKPADDENTIRQKISVLHNNMLNQASLLKQWHQQGGILTPEQSDKLLYIRPVITAYFTQYSLYQINENVTSVDELGREFRKYTDSVIHAIRSAGDSTIVDDTIISWIKTRFSL